MNMLTNVARYSEFGSHVLSAAEHFWADLKASTEFDDLIRYSALLSLLPLSGYLFYYTVIGKVWNYYPFVRTLISVPRAMMCAGLQWVFFTTFPLLSALFIDYLFSRKANGRTFHTWHVITTYSMTPVYLASLLVGVPFVNRIMILLGMATFVYLQYYGCRTYAEQSIIRSAAITGLTVAVFAFIRQMFVYVIGF